MTHDQIKALALSHGFTERQQADGSTDLNGYVYAFAEAMYAEGQRAMQERAAAVCSDREDDQWALYKGDPPYRGTECGRADSLVQGESYGAAWCANAIQAMEAKPS